MGNMKPIQNMMARLAIHICQHGSYSCTEVGDHVYLKFEASISFQTSIKIIDTLLLHDISF
jgi:hypothetical protein